MMSILRQLLLSITIAIAVIMLGVLAFSINAARGYLADQLQVQSADAAVSLALSLSQPSNSDPATQELLVTALFDGGHFSLVRLTDSEGRTAVQRQATAAYPSVPRWFRALVPLQAKSATHEVNDGWRRTGAVTLTANDSYAWETLWRSSLRMIFLVIGAGVLWALFAIALVRWIEKRLLGEISEQVRAIDQHPSTGRRLHARVREFSGVTEALNQTRVRLLATSEEQTARIESLQIEVNQDDVTHLANRKYFMNEFRRALAAGTPPTARPAQPAGGGYIIVFRQRDLAAINRHMPREFADQWLRSVATRTLELLASTRIELPVVARLNGSDFSVLMPRCAEPQAMLVADRLRTELRTLRIPVGEGDLCRWALAMAAYEPGAAVGDVLARLDYALMRAESTGDDHVVLPNDEAWTRSATGAMAWKDAILSGIEQQGFMLSTDALAGPDGKAMRHEATLMLRNGDLDPIPATLFIPPAVRLKLAGECDLQAIRLGLDWLRSHEGELAVRLSLPSLAEAGFLSRLERLLGANRAPAGRLFLEIDAHGLVERFDDVQALSRAVQPFGVRLGVRRLAQQFGAVSQLHKLPLSYVKLGGGFVAGLPQSPGSRQLTASILETARALAIEVYAEDVPDEQTRHILAGLGVTVMRGPAASAA